MNKRWLIVRYGEVFLKGKFRPLISWNKKEIVTKAQRIGIYELSLNQYEVHRSLFEPKYPVIKPKKEVNEKLEKEILWTEILEIIAEKISKSLEEKP